MLEASKIVVLFRLTAAAELVLELLYAASGVDETLLTSVNGMRVHGDVAEYLNALDAVNGLHLMTLCRDSGVRHELLSGRNVNENGWIIVGMNTFFHGENLRGLERVN